MKSKPPKIHLDPHPILREVAEPFDIDNSRADRISLSNRLQMFLPGSGGYAVAAPQIGISKAAFVYRVEDASGVVFNPTIVDYSDELWSFHEGCLSIPGKYWEIQRPRYVTVEGYNTKGEELHFELEDLLARVFQHEIDHLLGILCKDHVDGE